jgi:putative DNA methylase
MPLVSKWWLSTKKGKETWVEPVMTTNNARPAVTFVVRTGPGTPPEGTVNRRGARCLCCNTAVPFEHIRAEGKAGRMRAQLIAIVAEGSHGRVYVAPNANQEATANTAKPQWTLDTNLPDQALGFRVQSYGMIKHQDLFTARQLVALTTFSDLVAAARAEVQRDAAARGDRDAGAYADAVATYLALAVDKLADRNSIITSWASNREHARNTFTRQAIPMMWDFAESNVFSTSSGNWQNNVDCITKALEALVISSQGIAFQHDAMAVPSSLPAAAQAALPLPLIVSTDPPYYDNIGYADLSDFFYVWLRRMLGGIYPALFQGILTPKTNELIASPYRHGGDKAKAMRFFEEGLQRAFGNAYQCHHPDYPFALFYAFKQADSDTPDMDGINTISSTGWEKMLTGLLNAGFSVNGAWPMRTELNRRMLGQGTNALASSILLVCRPRPAGAPVATRREFLNALKAELPAALRLLQGLPTDPQPLSSLLAPRSARSRRSSPSRDRTGHGRL